MIEEAVHALGPVTAHPLRDRGARNLQTRRNARLNPSVLDDQLDEFASRFESQTSVEVGNGRNGIFRGNKLGVVPNRYRRASPFQLTPRTQPPWEEHLAGIGPTSGARCTPHRHSAEYFTARRGVPSVRQRCWIIIKCWNVIRARQTARRPLASGLQRARKDLGWSTSRG